MQDLLTTRYSVNTWRHDSAPSQTNRSSQACLPRKLSVLGVWFIPKETEPPHSPDLKVLDCAIWGVLKREVQGARDEEIPALKGKVYWSWRKTCTVKFNSHISRKLRSRLLCVIALDGGIFEGKWTKY